MGFTGSISAKLDAKGRVFLPSDFRKQLTKCDGRLVLKRDVYQPCLVVYPYEVWEAEVEALRARLNRWDARGAMVFRQFLAEAEIFTLDSNGRFLLPRYLLEAAGIEKEVRFIGVDDRVEIWSETMISRSFLSREDFAEALTDLMSPPQLL